MVYAGNHSRVLRSTKWPRDRRVRSRVGVRLNRETLRDEIDSLAIGARPRTRDPGAALHARGRGLLARFSQTVFTVDFAFRFAAALGIGLLLGLERERSVHDDERVFGGVRTFALITLFGAIAAFAQHELDQTGLALAMFGAVSALIAVSYAVTASRGEIGMTSEVTALLAFVLGALCGFGAVGVASAAA